MLSSRSKRGPHNHIKCEEDTFQLVCPGDGGPVFALLLADYANYSGIGHKTTHDLGYVRTHIASNF